MHGQTTLKILLPLDSMQYLFISHPFGLPGILHSSPVSHFKTSQSITIHFPGDQVSAPDTAYFTSFFFKFKSNLLVKILFKCPIFDGKPGYNFKAVYGNAVYSDSHTKQINALCGNNSGLLNVTSDSYVYWTVHHLDS